MCKNGDNVGKWFSACPKRREDPDKCKGQGSFRWLDFITRGEDGQHMADQLMAQVPYELKNAVPQPQQQQQPQNGAYYGQPAQKRPRYESPQTPQTPVSNLEKTQMMAQLQLVIDSNQEMQNQVKAVYKEVLDFEAKTIKAIEQLNNNATNQCKELASSAKTQMEVSAQLQTMKQQLNQLVTSVQNFNNRARTTQTPAKTAASRQKSKPAPRKRAPRKKPQPKPKPQPEPEPEPEEGAEDPVMDFEMDEADKMDQFEV